MPACDCVGAPVLFDGAATSSKAEKMHGGEGYRLEKGNTTGQVSKKIPLVPTMKHKATNDQQLQESFPSNHDHSC